MWEQRKYFLQYLGDSKTKFDEIIGDEASLTCNKVFFLQTPKKRFFPRLHDSASWLRASLCNQGKVLIPNSVHVQHT